MNPRSVRLSLMLTSLALVLVVILLVMGYTGMLVLSGIAYVVGVVVTGDWLLWKRRAR